MIDVMYLENANLLIENGHVVAVIIDPDQFAAYLKQQTSPDVAELKTRIGHLEGRVIEEHRIGQNVKTRIEAKLGLSREEADEWGRDFEE
ncbi:MAG: hypothetical protein V3R81_00950 [Gammaproteobacteria bacterium]